MPNKINWMGTELERFRSYIEVAENGCWIWKGHTVKGYGRFKLPGSRKTIGTHVWSYMRFVGPIPEGMELDHLCRNRACANPLHLEAVTGKTNSLRGVSPAASNAKKTHCNNGHDLREARTDSRGWRVCVKCEKKKRKAYRLRRKNEKETSSSNKSKSM